MATPRGLGSLLLLLLLPTSGQEKTTEQPRNTCLGRNNIDKYDILNLNDKASCFTKCRQWGSDSCNVENLQRYWLNFEAHLVKEGLTEKVNMPFLKALVQNLSTNTAEDLYFSLKPSQIPRQVMKDEDKPPDRVRLPKSFFRSLPGNRSEVRLAITILDIGSGTLFKNMTLTCVFWDVTKGPTGDWASEGCSTEVVPEGTVCCCDHLTFFALLLRPTLDQSTVHILTRISQAGCGVSMIFLAFTIILYAVLRLSRQRFQSEDAPKIHVALGGSLFLLNLAFLVNVGSGSKGSDAACWARGAVFHYFLLCAFTWMGLEAFHLYLLAIRVFNTYFGHYFLKLSLVGWGLPALIVIGTGSANSYGLYTIRDRENRTSLELCWFREGTAMYALYITVHGYFLITFLFGMVVLALVAWKIFTLSGATAVKERGQNRKKVLTILGLSSLVGVTWGLAIFTPLGLSTVYIFALFNSLQGVFICCWFTILYLPSQSTTVSSSTARLDQAHSASQE
ncbi:adhesion G protein-coupled receptor G3 isoform X2 [Piliocolobus tephrosceles]|uniref:Adhesion G protein-coupled receptor G3 n=1 Tax=Piliocolobus tephrosceles TaxID=591936 RepID=A0A8C9HTG6_9PRIM|nr:adhesion G protein-coupled receptor G3 isoform X2 [Piliocolobus tephrosceles]